MTKYCLGRSYSILHEEVQSSPKWMNSDELRTFAKSKVWICSHNNNFKQILSILIYLYLEIEERKYYLLKKREMESLAEHIEKLEIDTMKNYDFFVCTVGALADKRVERWSKCCGIRTVIIDEAGQLTHPATLVTTCVNPARLVFAGDHQQLRASINSFASDLAGLDRSFLEWNSLRRYNKEGFFVILILLFINFKARISLGNS